MLFFNKKQQKEMPQPQSTIDEGIGFYNDTIIDINSIEPMVTFDHLPPHYQAPAIQAVESWRNVVANINAGNSLTQHNEYVLNRLSYSECAQLATETMISKAITTLTNEVFKEGGTWNGDDKEFIKAFVNEWDNFSLTHTIRLWAIRALQYGGAFLYIDTTDDDISLPLYINDKTKSSSRLLGFKIIEPWQTAPIKVNSWNPLRDDYMKPTHWYLLGASQNVHSSRLLPLVFFDVADLIKPLFNYLGLPLSFYMKSYVSSADITRKSIAELALRFRTDYIKTSAQKIKDPKVRARIKYMNYTQNNFGKVLLTQDETLEQINTPLSGLSDILVQMYQLAAIPTSMPVTKFLGLSPKGLNSTGEHELNNFYDLIAGYQTTIFKPNMERLAQIITALKMNSDIKSSPTFEFSPLNRLNSTEKAQLNKIHGDYLLQLAELNLLTKEDILRAIKENDFSFHWVTNPADNPDQINKGEKIDIETLMENINYE